MLCKKNKATPKIILIKTCFSLNNHVYANVVVVVFVVVIVVGGEPFLKPLGRKPSPLVQRVKPPGYNRVQEYDLKYLLLTKSNYFGRQMKSDCKTNVILLYSQTVSIDQEHRNFGTGDILRQIEMYYIFARQTESSICLYLWVEPSSVV